MTPQIDFSSCRQLTLSHDQVLHIACVFRRAIEQVRGWPETDILQAVYDRIDDGMWLSQWTRDYVKFEATPEECLAMLQAITTALSEDDLTANETSASEALLRQLSSATFESTVDPNSRNLTRERNSANESPQPPGVDEEAAATD